MWILSEISYIIHIMPNHDARAIANEFLERRSSTAWPSQMHVQKLVHIANGWNLAINGQPLVAELPEAWDNGPVFRSIWNWVRDWGFRGPNYTLAKPGTDEPFTATLTPSERQVIDGVWAKYGSYSGDALSRMTHKAGTPWHRAYFDRGRNSSLRTDEIRQHYRELGLAGRR